MSNAKFNEIVFGGMSNVPGDYDCGDGELASSMNLINEDGGVRGLERPVVKFRIDDGDRLLVVHKVQGGSNYIFSKVGEDGIVSLYWTAVDDYNVKHEIGSASFSEIKDVAIIGNTLSVAASDGLHYILWKGGVYEYLGQRPELPRVVFGLKNGYAADYGIDFFYEATVPAICVIDESSVGRLPNEDDYRELTENLYAGWLKEYGRNIREGKMSMPFYVRYAYRLYDGSYVWHSSPVLMLPSTMQPILVTRQYSDGLDGTHKKATVNVMNFNPCSLLYTIQEVVEEFGRWKDIVSGIDVFVSQPIWTFDQSRDIEQRPWLRAKDFFGKSDAVSVDGGEYRFFATDSYNRLNNGEAPGEKIKEIDFSGVYGDDAKIWNIELHKDFYKNLKRVSNFYKVGGIDFDGIADCIEAELVLDNENLENLSAFPTLPDDYHSRHVIVAHSLYSYNNRLNIGGLSLSAPKPFGLGEMVPMREYTGGVSNTVELTVFTRMNGIKTYSGITYVTPNIYMPRYIYYPDASAYKMQVSVRRNDYVRTYVIPLTAHDFLNGAYYFGGLSPDYSLDKMVTEGAEDTTGLPCGVELFNEVYTSEVNNPFLFRAEDVATCGSGRILRLCSATRALSQGQFGQFPMYAFTDEGIWALSVSESGGFSARQPVSRDVCINSGGITQIDGGVAYPTARGVMMISGSEVSNMTEVLSSDNPFDVSGLPEFGKLLGLLGVGEEKAGAYKIRALGDMLKDSRMLYDYRHSHIYVFSDGMGYAYVYSMKSRKWGMSSLDISYCPVTYPEAIAVDSENNVLDFTNGEGVMGCQLLVTRPLRIDRMPDMLKTVDVVFTRGKFDEGSVRSVLYGSRDLEHWFVVSTSNSEKLRRFGGTPYKYHRLLLLLELGEGESVTKASVQYRIKYNNRLR